MSLSILPSGRDPDPTPPDPDFDEPTGTLTIVLTIDVRGDVDRQSFDDARHDAEWDLNAKADRRPVPEAAAAVEESLRKLLAARGLNVTDEALDWDLSLAPHAIEED